MVSDFLEFTPPVIAHRGARANAPENTLAAFKAAYEEGARWVETDVKLTVDGMPILMHDDTVDRTTNGKGAVSEKTWSEIQNLDAGSWFSPKFAGTRVAALAELLAFSCASGMRINLELKPSPGRTRATVMVSLIEASKLWPENAPPLLISSFDVEALMIAMQLHPGWPRGLLIDKWREDWRELATMTQASTLNINANLLTAERLAFLRGTHVPILAYTVNDPLRAKELLANGVRAVFSDNPRKILDAL